MLTLLGTVSLRVHRVFGFVYTGENHVKILRKIHILFQKLFFFVVKMGKLFSLFLSTLLKYFLILTKEKIRFFSTISHDFSQCRPMSAQAGAV